MSRRRSSVKGAASFRRLLKALPDSAPRKVVDFLSAAGPVMATKMRALIPVLAVPRANRTPGAARNSIGWKVTPKSMNLKVGELTKRDKVFYAHILDVGRKAQTVPITRGPRAGGKMRVGALAPRHIVRQTKALFLSGSLPGYRTLMQSILQDASRGVGDD